MMAEIFIEILIVMIATRNNDFCNTEKRTMPQEIISFLFIEKISAQSRLTPTRHIQCMFLENGFLLFSYPKIYFLIPL